MSSPGDNSPETKRRIGRPRKLTAEEQQEIYERFERYVLDNDDPTLPYFVTHDDKALEYGVSRDDLNNWTEFYTLIKTAVQKQESYLLTHGMKAGNAAAFTIFRLKQPQHGYTDKSTLDGTQEIVITTRRHKRNARSD